MVWKLHTTGTALLSPISSEREDVEKQIQRLESEGMREGLLMRTGLSKGVAKNV